MIQALVRGSPVWLCSFAASMTSPFAPYRSALYRRARRSSRSRRAALAADAPNQVAIVTKAGPTDPLSLTIEPTTLPAVANSGEPKPLPILGKIVAPGTTEVLYWSPGVSFDGNSIPRGVLVANGAQPGTDAVPHGGRARRRTQRSRNRPARAVRDRSCAPQRSRYRRADRQSRRLPPRHALPARPARSESLLPRQGTRQRGRASRALAVRRRHQDRATTSSTSTPVRFTAPTSRRCAAI